MHKALKEIVEKGGLKDLMEPKEMLDLQVYLVRMDFQGNVGNQDQEAHQDQQGLKEKMDTKVFPANLVLKEFLAQMD